MSITAKQHLIKSVSAELSRDLTAYDLTTVQDKLNDVLSMYEVENAPEGKRDAESNDLIDAFLTAKKIEGRSDKTLGLYRYRINQLVNALNIPIRRITVFHLRKYLMDGKEKGLADKTLEGMRSIYCSFFSWTFNEGLLPSNPCANLSPIKCSKIVRLPYSDVDIEKLKEECVGNRNKAIMAFLLSTGCRVSEMCGLNRDAIDFAHGEVTVLGKGAKERTVFLTDVAMMYIKRYLNERTDDYPALFIGRCTERIKPNAVRKMLHDVAERAGVTDVHPHRFRRTLATNLIGHGMPIQDVATVLGHDKLDTTLTYSYRAKDDIHNNYLRYA